MDYITYGHIIIYAVTLALIGFALVVALWNDGRRKRSLALCGTVMITLFIVYLALLQPYDRSTENSGGFNEKEYKGHRYLFYKDQYIGPCPEPGKPAGTAADSTCVHLNTPIIKEYYYEY